MALFTKGSNTSAKEKPVKLPAGATRIALDAFVDVQAIENNLIRRKDGWYAGLIEVQGEAFGLLTPDEQDLRIEAYGRVLTGLQDNWQIQVTRLVEPTNLTSLIEYFEGVAQREGRDQAIGQLADTYEDLMETFQQSLLSHVTLMTVWAKTPEDCREKVSMLLASLQDNQFLAAQCDTERIGVILQIVYGHDPVSLADTLGGWTASIQRHQQALEAEKVAAKAQAKSKGKRGRTKKDPDAVLVDTNQPPVLAPVMPTLRDVLEPAAIIEHPGYLDLGGLYTTTLVNRTWPEQVSNGWLEWLYNFEEPGVRRRVSFYVESLPSSRVMADLRRRQVQLDAETHWARKRGLREDFDIQIGEEAIDFLREEIGRGRQRMFLTTLFVTIMADSPERLRETTRHLIQKAAGYLVTLRPLYLEETLGFRATVPLGVQPLRGAPDRGIPTVALATTFPFSAGEILDPVGDVWGENRSTGNLVVLDPDRFQAKHMVVVAKTRSGKSATLKVLASQALFRPDEEVIVIDPSPPIDYERWTRWFKGTYAQFGPGSNDGINPLEILMPASMDRIDDSMRAPIRAKIAFGSELFGLMGHQPLTPEEQAGAEEVLAEVFAAHGMPVSTTGTGESEWAVVQDREAMSLLPRAKAAPTLTEVWDALRNRSDTAGLAMRIKPFITGMFNMFAGSTTIDMNKQLVVFNVYNLVQGSAGKQHQAVAYAMIAEFIRWRLAQSQRRTFVIVDEGHVMFQREDTARFVSQLFRMAGKQGGRVALLTQGIVDIMGDPSTGMNVPGQADARFCIENSGFKLLMRNDNENDVELIGRTLGITIAEGRAIKSAKRGQGILLIGDAGSGTQRAYVQVIVPPLLYPWITSTPEEVERFRLQGVYEAIEAPRPQTVVVEPAIEPANPFKR